MFPHVLHATYQYYTHSRTHCIAFIHKQLNLVIHGRGDVHRCRCVSTYSILILNMQISSRGGIAFWHPTHPTHPPPQPRTSITCHHFSWCNKNLLHCLFLLDAAPPIAHIATLQREVNMVAGGKGGGGQKVDNLTVVFVGWYPHLFIFLHQCLITRYYQIAIWFALLDGVCSDIPLR